VENKESAVEIGDQRPRIKQTCRDQKGSLKLKGAALLGLVLSGLALKK